jgi:ABC-type Fe3+ transport system permease subunit
VHLSRDRRSDGGNPRERREGSSRLSRWTGRQLLVACLAWIGLVVALIAVGFGASLGINHGATEARLALTQSSLLGLVAAVVIPPLCIAAQWLRMRGRRRGRQSTSG